MRKKQLTLRGIVIGVIGSIVITMSSMFVALKLSSLPWPIMFVSLASMFALKIFGNTDNNEINVTQTVMSAGAMVAGGLAFTIPGIWILDANAKINFWTLLCVTLGGVLLGLIITALVRKYFVETEHLPYVMGEAAAETIKLGDEGGAKAIKLFSAMGISAIFTLVRDWFKSIPSMWLSDRMSTFGSDMGVWFSPMLISMGYMIGPIAVGVWFLGAVIADFGILFAGESLNLLDQQTALDIKSSLGIGLMLGTGIGIFVKGILPKAKDIFGGMFKKNADNSILNLRWEPIAMVLLVFVLTYLCDFGFLASIIAILGVWLTTSMSAQCVGQSGINPMEIFGILVLLVVKFITDIDNTGAFLVAAMVAVACGLVGDVMNDFKVGYILKSNPKEQWIAEAIGGIVGAIVSVLVIYVIIEAYGSDVFGSEMFPAAQASAVSAMIGGISNMAAFVLGICIAVVLYCLNVPVMTLGLGVYLPFYMSATVAIGGLIRFIVDKKTDKSSEGSIIASGLLGGEAMVGVIIAIVTAIRMLM